ncbi:hypothetical protein ABC382_00355 [Lysinibacillus sp. 1P01SD]|uniref:hypothetical protein n=1 Tax=Lysinibacillus sp. 1P01SD TaxID=3132285 RepID=UPI0039A2F452
MTSASISTYKPHKCVFAESLEWSFESQIIPSNKRMNERAVVNIKNKKVFNRILSAIQFIHYTGVAESSQLFRLFGLKQVDIKYLVKNRVLVRHEIKTSADRRKKGQNFRKSIYTLDEGARVLCDTVYREQNYWLSFTTQMVLKVLAFIELFIVFKEAFPHSENLFVDESATIKPFTGVIDLNGKLFHVYVVRGKTSDLESYIRVNSNKSIRLCLLVENPNHIKPLIPRLTSSKMMVRVIDENEIAQDDAKLEELFYFIQNGGLIKEHLVMD